MKRSIFAGTAIFFLMSMLGCTKVPDEVIRDMSGYREENQNHRKDFAFERIKTSELSDNVEAALNKNFSQFFISEKIKFVQPDEIYVMSFEKLTDFNDFDGAMKIFFDEDVLNRQEIETSDDGYKSFCSESEKIFGSMDSDGFIAVLKPHGFDISYSGDAENLKIYHINRKDDISDSYSINECEYSVAQTVDFVNDWLSENYSGFSPEFEYKCETVIARRLDEQYYYQILANASYKGVPLDSYTRKLKLINGQDTGKMAYCDFGIQIQMMSPDDISTFTNLIGMLIPHEVSRVNECISLESALEYCANEFTDFKNTEISDIGIMYTLIPVYDVDKEILTKEDNARIIGYESRPVWEIVMDIPRDALPHTEQGKKLGDMRKYIYIDMITGETDYDFEPSSRY